jgi:hypothetical protein
MKTPEYYEKQDITAYLDGASIDIWFYKPYMAGYGKSGVPDIVGVYRGKFFSIEVKRPGKNPTMIQGRRMQEIAKAGGKTFWGPADKVCAEFEEWIRT